MLEALLLINYLIPKYLSLILIKLMLPGEYVYESGDISNVGARFTRAGLAYISLLRVNLLPASHNLST